MNRLREECEKSGQEFVPEPKEWEVIEEKPFDFEIEEYVVCIDTLG